MKALNLRDVTSPIQALKDRAVIAEELLQNAETKIRELVKQIETLSSKKRPRELTEDEKSELKEEEFKKKVDKWRKIADA